MKKIKNFILGIYEEFIENVTLPKWNKLYYFVLKISISTIFFSFILHFIDEIFIWILQKLF
ncbi:MAG TPA: preprotein translocase subunit SecE [Candidatus Angelobacter sp.]|nr:preprotein translocase subunit SecE [Candidatus Angelobacter sp.]